MSDKNLKQYKNKNTIYNKIPGHPGIYRIMNWSERALKYVPQTMGAKFYVVKRVDGKQVTKTFIEMSEAKNWKLQDELPEDILKEWLFKDVKAAYLVNKKQRVRIATYETTMSKIKHLHFFDKYKMSEITPQVIDRWIVYIKTPEYLKSQHSHRIFYKHEYAELRQVLTYYAEYICEGAYDIPLKARHKKDLIVDKQKFDEHMAQNKKKFLNEKEIRNFLYAMNLRTNKKSDIEQVFELLALLQINSGTRIGEAAGVHWEDICFENKSVAILNTVTWSRNSKARETFISKTTKTAASRVVPLPNYLVTKLSEWRLKSGRSKGLVFSYDGITPLKYRAISHRYDAALIKIGSNIRGTHIARHSFATNFLEKTGDHRALQEILGHQTSRQTDHYAKMTGVRAEAAMKHYEQAMLNQDEPEVETPNLQNVR